MIILVFLVMKHANIFIITVSHKCALKLVRVTSKKIERRNFSRICRQWHTDLGLIISSYHRTISSLSGAFNVLLINKVDVELDLILWKFLVK